MDAFVPAKFYGSARTHLCGLVSNSRSEYWLFNPLGQAVTTFTVVTVFCFLYVVSPGFLEKLKDIWAYINGRDGVKVSEEFAPNAYEEAVSSERANDDSYLLVQARNSTPPSSPATRYSPKGSTSKLKATQRTVQLSSQFVPQLPSKRTLHDRKRPIILQDPATPRYDIFGEHRTGRPSAHGFQTPCVNTDKDVVKCGGLFKGDKIFRGTGRDATSSTGKYLDQERVAELIRDEEKTVRMRCEALKDTKKE